MLRIKVFIYLLSIFSLCIFFNKNVYSYNQNPNLNFGSTNIIDAILPPSGTWLNTYIAGYSSDEFKDEDGDNIKIGNQDLADELNLLAVVPQFVYFSKNKFWDHFQWGIQFIPFEIINFNVDSKFLSSENSMIGDMCIGPLFGRTEHFGKNWHFNWFVEFDTYIPIGEYDKHKDLNPSANYWTFEPWISFTLQMPHGFSISSRQHFTYNFENDDFIVTDPKSGIDYETELQAGTMWHFNYSFMKKLNFIEPNLRIGIVGYYAKQLEDDDIDNFSTLENDTKEQVFAIGPGLYWRTKTGIVLSLKAYFESQVENRPEGNRLVLRIINKLW